MNKITLNVPDGIEHLSDWQELWNTLPTNQHYILNKGYADAEQQRLILDPTRKSY